MLRELKSLIIKILKKYSVDSIFLFLPIIVSVTIALFTWPIVLNNLPIEDYGKLQFVLAIQLLAIGLTGSYISTGVKTSIARGYKGTFLYSFLYRLKLVAILSALGLFTALILYYFNDQTISYLFIIVFIYTAFGHLVNVSYINYFIAKRQFKMKAAWQITGTIIVNIMSAVIAYFTHNIFIFTVTQLGLITIISWLGFIYIIKKENLYHEYKIGNIDKRCIPYGLKLIPAHLAGLIGTKISSFIIGPFFGYANLSIFYTASNLRDKFAMMIRLINPLLYSDFAKRGRTELLNYIKSKLKIFFVYSTTFMILAATGGYAYISLFLPQEYQNAKLFYIILSVIFSTSAVSFILNTYLESQLMHKELRITKISSDVIKIVFILIFGYFWGIIGICIAITISGFISYIIYHSLLFKPNLLANLLKKLLN